MLDGSPCYVCAATHQMKLLLAATAENLRRSWTKLSRRTRGSAVARTAVAVRAAVEVARAAVEVAAAAVEVARAAVEVAGAAVEVAGAAVAAVAAVVAVAAEGPARRTLPATQVVEAEAVVAGDAGHRQQRRLRPRSKRPRKKQLPR